MAPTSTSDKAKPAAKKTKHTALPPSKVSKARPAGKPLPRVRTPRKTPFQKAFNGSLSGEKERAAEARASQFAEGEEEEDDYNHFDYSKNFSPNSVASLTWGTYTTTPSLAVTHKRKRTSTVKYSSERAADGSDVEEIPRKKIIRAKKIIQNGPDTSGFLKLALETRQQIYGYLFTYEKPILLHNFRAFCHSIPYSHALLQSCRQINNEASEYVYKHNVFQALVCGNPYHDWGYRPTMYLAPRFLPLLKNVVIDCSTGSSGDRWAHDSVRCVNTLLHAQVCLDSFTIVLDSLMLQNKTDLIPEITILKCKTFRMIVKVYEEPSLGALITGLGTGSGVPKRKVRRVLVEVDTRPLLEEEVSDTRVQDRGGNVAPVYRPTPKSANNPFKPVAQNEAEITPEAQDAAIHAQVPVGRLDLYPVVVAARRERRKKAEAQMRGLKELIEEIKKNPDAAVLRGDCRFMQDGEH